MPNTHRIAKLEGSRPLGRLTRRWVGNIKTAGNVLTPCKGHANWITRDSFNTGREIQCYSLTLVCRLCAMKTE
jgi:hypothetical protein